MASASRPIATTAITASSGRRSRCSSGADAKSLAARASRLERTANLAKAEEDLTRAALATLAPDATKKDAVRKAHDVARAAVEAARKALDAPGESYTPLTGSRKTLESNVETEELRNKPFPAISTGRRAALARWLTDRRHPLTARVAVNHIWMRHMNRPLVESVADFGLRAPTPPEKELLDWLDLAAHADERCEGFSKGMRQKVALAGALVHEPQGIILDEPLTGLDAGSARQVKNVLRERVRAGGAIISWKSPNAWPTASASLRTAGSSPRARSRSCTARRGAWPTTRAPPAAAWRLSKMRSSRSSPRRQRREVSTFSRVIPEAATAAVRNP